MAYLKVRNLHKYQHYSNRRPPWLKLHRSILDHPEYAGLTPSQWRLGLEIALLCSEREDEQIDANPTVLSWRLRRKITQKDVSALVSIRFLVLVQDASKMLADDKQVATSETETETETETEERQNVYPPGFARAWASYPHHGTRSKKADALRLWTKQKNETEADAVCEWIEYAKTTEDWRKEQGQFVPAFQAWIRNRDFSDEHPKPRINLREVAGEKGARSIEALNRWREEQEAKDAAGR